MSVREIIGGRFELEREVGAGGMGSVFAARDLSTGARVAVKVLINGASLDRFAREVSLLAEIKHPNVVRYVAHGVTDHQRAWMAMEWLEGEDLASRIAKSPLAIHETISIGIAAASALAAAHERGLIHRDVKPANLFLVGGSTATDNLRLVDFGVARALYGQRLTQTGMTVGTPAYMAPEQARGEEELDVRADLFSLGCVLFECLAGDVPFSGPSVMAILAKVLLEPAPEVTAHRIDTPRWLGRLVSALLAKSKADRPPDARAVKATLEAGLETTRESIPPSIQSSAVGLGEQRVVSVLVAPGLPLTPGHEPTASQRAARRIIEENGGQAHHVVDGSLIAIFSATSPSEAAGNAAKTALALGRSHGTIAVATGRAVMAPLAPVGDALDRAAKIAMTDGAGVHVDEATRALLDGQYEFDVRTSSPRLVTTKQANQSDVRVVLGRAMPFVGRDRELATLAGILDEAASDKAARGSLVLAPAGGGKSRLLGEVVRAGRDRGFDVIVARADGGGTYALAAAILGAAARAADPGVDRMTGLATRLARLEERVGERAAEVLGEIMHATVLDPESEDAMRAAERDPAMLGDAIRSAWEAWLLAETKAHPILLALDDLGLADRPSLNLVEAALGRLEQRAFVVVGTARPEIYTRFPRLWDERNVQVIRLPGLPRRAGERLVRHALGEKVAEPVVLRILERAAGNPFVIEELVRIVGGGGSSEEVPDTIVGIMQARFDAIDTSARRTLRAASVVGPTFWNGLVAELVAEDRETVDSHLGILAALDFVARAPTSDVAGEVEYVFKTAIVQTAAAATLTDADRRNAHRVCAQWLEARNAGAPLVLASHYEGARDPRLAARWYAQAAEEAVEGGDYEAAIEAVERALHAAEDASTVAPSGPTDAGHDWRSDAEKVEHIASRVARAAGEGSVLWFRALGLAGALAGRLGASDRVGDVLARATKAAHHDAPGAAARAVCLARCASELVWNGAKALSQEADQPDPFAAGWIHRTRADAALRAGRLEAACGEYARAVEAFDRAGTERHSCVSRALWAGSLAFAGDDEKARKEAARALQMADALGSPFSRMHAVHAQGLVHAAARRDGEMIACMREVAAAASDPRIVVSALAHLALGLRAMDDLAAAMSNAEDAVRRAGTGWRLRSVALAALSLCKLARGAREEALDAARAAATGDDPPGFFDIGLGLPQLALAEALEAARDREGARAAIRDALAHLRAVPKLVEDATHRRVVALAQAWEVLS